MAKYWLIPITIVEYGREVVICADTKAEALSIFRAGHWDQCTDPESYKVTKVGRCRPEEER